MAVDVIVGLQRGDEGKGRFVDMLAENYDIVARFNGGDNAGHTVVLPDNRMLKLHMLPSGIAHDGVVNVIGNGALVNPVNLAKEIESVRKTGIEVSSDNLKISSGARLILPHHISIDEVREEGSAKQGSTKSGIAPAAADKAMRVGARVEAINMAVSAGNTDELWNLVYDGLEKQHDARAEAGLGCLDEIALTEAYIEAALSLGAYVTDTAFYLNQRLKEGQRILAEGAQAFLLDNDHGMSPYTTSSSTTSGGVSTGLGVPPQVIDKVTGVIKAVQSHVGDGPFVTEVTEAASPELLARLHGDMHAPDAERGTTTGRTRRLGYLDIPQIRRANMINGTGEMALTKLDWIPRFGPHMPVCVTYTRKGKVYEIAPDAAYKLEQSEPNYEYIPTWDGDIRHVTEFKDLPKEARDIVNLLEDSTDIPITMIGVGQRRDQVIVRDRRRSTTPAVVPFEC